jgi:hypothetical protein
MDYRDEDIGEKEILLDGSTFSGCTFHHCRLTFRGEAKFVITACHFKEDVRWAFDGPARLTLNALLMLQKEGGRPGKQIVKHVVEQILREG